MSRNKGFTLMELMIAMAIIAIVAAIAYPAYTKSAMKGRRAEAKSALTRISQALERCYTQYGQYNSGNCTPYVDGSGNFVTQDSKGDSVNNTGYYSISASAFNGTAYTLSATARSGGVQANDTGCTTMTLANTGAQGPSGCWN